MPALELRSLPVREGSETLIMLHIRSFYLGFLQLFHKGVDGLLGPFLLLVALLPAEQLLHRWRREGEERVEAGHDARLEGGVVGWKKDLEKLEDRCKLVVHNQDSANMWALRSWEDFFRRQPVCISASAYALKDDFYCCSRDGGQVKNNLFGLMEGGQALEIHLFQCVL